jgi:hypothetical protein
LVEDNFVGAALMTVVKPVRHSVEHPEIVKRTSAPPQNKSSTYKVVLNQMLPWQKKLVVPFRPNEISHVDIDKSGRKVTGITKFELVPVQRTLWLDKDSFHTAKDYWILCGRQIGEVGQLEK